ncbi:hypothetical protein ACL02R_24900 [Streptomyces sp. MS19]|uniref:hypothetical protein n=1 Tax=Streptomyces sp. MS19 TaxID=3385972 RepID=UPI0039A13274
MIAEEPTGARQFLDTLARLWGEEDDEWRFEAVADGSALVARTVVEYRSAPDARLVALVDARALDATVTVDDVARVADLAARVGAAPLEKGKPAAFVCTRRVPSAEAVQAACLRGVRILSVRELEGGRWGYDRSVLSSQEFTQPRDAAAIGEDRWSSVHADADRAVFRDARGVAFSSFEGLRAVLEWEEETEVSPGGGAWGRRRFGMPAGTSMTLPGHPPVPVSGVTLAFHRETRELRATREEGAFRERLSAWLWG